MIRAQQFLSLRRRGEGGLTGMSWGLKERTQCCINAFPPSRREVANRNVCGLWKSDTRPVHPESLPGPGVACSLPQVCRVQPVPGRELHLLRPRRKDLL